MNINVSPAFRMTNLSGNIKKSSKRKKPIRAERRKKKRRGELWASFLAYTGNHLNWLTRYFFIKSSTVGKVVLWTCLNAALYCTSSLEQAAVYLWVNKNIQFRVASRTF